MKKISFALVLAMIFALLSALAVPAAADAMDSEFLNFEGVSEKVPSGNLLTGSSFDDNQNVVYWNPRSQTLEQIETSTGGYLRMSNISSPIVAFDFTQGTASGDKVIGAGIYKFTGYFRTVYEGELTMLRFYIYDANHSNSTYYGAKTAYIYPTSDEWLKVEFYVTLDSQFTGLRVCGGPYNEFIQSYAIDNFSLVKVNAIPDDYVENSVNGNDGSKIAVFGTPVTNVQAEASNNGSAPMYRPWDPEREEKYDVQGIIINRDCDFIGTCNENNLTRQMLIDYANSYKGTHVTDFMMNIFCQVAVYPSQVTTDFIDQYHYYAEHDPEKITANQLKSYLIYEEKGIDYISVLREAFKDIGIDYWLSYRMNDAHGYSGEGFPENKITMDFYYKNPQYRRVQHPCTQNSYYHSIFDYTHVEVREHMLQMINESLSMYDCDGIELDFQREMRIWHNGGEYAGLDILTEFMREINRIVDIYENVRGHEIKIAVRCGSDIETNYDFGYDVITWAAEGLMDLVNPTSRWRSIDFNVPTRMWAALMHPYGVEVAPGIESLINTHPSASIETRHTLETLAGASANWLSQGADKIYMYNFFLSGSNPILDVHRVSTNSNALGITGVDGHFNMLTSIGSYEKIMSFDRRILASYNDVEANWKPAANALPLTISRSGSIFTGYTYNTGALRFPMGDVQAGSTVEFNFSAQNVSTSNPPIVYINGEQAPFVKAEYVSSGYTTNIMLTYTVPESAYDDGYLVVEITPKAFSSILASGISIDYADIYIRTQK